MDSSTDIAPSIYADPPTPQFGIVDAADLPPEFRNKVVQANADIPQHIDFFDVLESQTFYFPDKVQWVSLKVFTEGDRRNYLNQTNREVRMNTVSKELKMQNHVGDDRHALLMLSINGWNIYRNGQPIAFNRHSLEEALKAWPPTLVDMIEKKVREINPWMQPGEESLEALREERAGIDAKIQAIEDRAAKN